MAQSSSELTTIHLRRLATPGRKYYGDNEKIYLGMPSGHLKLLDDALSNNTSNSIYQNAVGSILTDTSTIDLTYNSSSPSIIADLKSTTVVPGTYGSSILSPRINIDSTGRITTALNIPIILPPGSITLTNNNILVGSATNVAVDIAMSGEASIVAAGTVTLLNSAVIGKVITGYISGAGVLAATDTILEAFNKINGNISALITGVSSVNGLVGAVALTGTANRVTISATNVFDTGTDIVTLTGAQALSNKTGLISQWTNNSGYLTTAILSIGAIGAVPNANGATLTGTVLNIEPASDLFGGIVTTGTQTLVGAKTFNNTLKLADPAILDFGQNATKVGAPTDVGGAGTTIAINGYGVSNFYGIGFSDIRNARYDLWFKTGNSNGGGYRFYTGATERVTIDYIGNVGIGTSTPASALSFGSASSTITVNTAD